MLRLTVAEHDLVYSMSGKGNCQDNAVAGGLFHTLKVELIHGESFASQHAPGRI